MDTLSSRGVETISRRQDDRSAQDRGSLRPYRRNGGPGKHVFRRGDKGSSMNDVTQFWRIFYPSPLFHISTLFSNKALVF